MEAMWHEDRAEVFAYQPHQLRRLRSPLLFWSSSFIVEALCGCAWSLSWMIGTLLFILVWICFVAIYFDKLLLWFDGARSWRFGGAFLIAWRKWARED